MQLEGFEGSDADLASHHLVKGLDKHCLARLPALESIQAPDK